MIKVLIVDDEIQIRKGLRMKINWEEEGFMIIEEASNGKEAIEKLKQMEIEVIITDVKMPIMDGIEFVNICHRNYSKVKLIVLSGYSDFYYAKSALQAGVKDYLLKPVAPNELVESLRKIRIELENEKRKQLEDEQITSTQLEEKREQYLLYLVKEEFSDIKVVLDRLKQLQLVEFLSLDVQVQFITVEMRGLEESTETIEDYWIPFKIVCKEIAENFNATLCFHDASYGKMIHFIVKINGELVTQKSPFIKTIQNEIKEILNLETVVGIGKVVTGHLEFKTGYISSLLSWSQSQLCPHSQVIEEMSTDEVFDFSLNDEKKLINAIERVDYSTFQKYLNGILEDKQSIMSFTFVTNRVLFLLSSISKKYDVNVNEINHIIWNCQQTILKLNSQKKVIDLLNELGNLIMVKVSEVRSSSSCSQLVEKVRHYLDKQYASDITLSALSEQFHINSAYLSEVFKNHVGQKFSDYLTLLRMENAMKFLKDPELKIIDVAQLVGFFNPGYFSTVFKKHTGQTPAEYRKSLNL